MKTIFALIVKEYKLFWSDRVAVSLTFIIPLLLIMLWGSIFGRIDSGPENLRMAFLNNSNAAVGKKIELVLDTSHVFKIIKSYKNDAGEEVPFDTNSIKAFVMKGSASAALVIPYDAYSDTSIGLRLKFYYDPKNAMELEMIEGMLQQTVMSQIPQVLLEGAQRMARKALGVDSGKAFNGAIARVVSKFFNVDTNRIMNFRLNDSAVTSSPIAKRGGEFFKNIMQLDKEQLVGNAVANPWATRSVGGWAMMFLMFTLSNSAASLFDEKKNGVVLRMLAAPISRVHILWSKYLYSMSLGFIQLLVLFIGGAVLFHIDILSNLFNLLLIIIAAATACTAFGMLLSAVSKTAAQANGMATFLILAMSSVGGAWFPTTFMPDYIQAFSKLTIVYWSMDGFLQVLWRGVGTLDILPNIGILFGIAALITSISIWQFKKGHVF